MITIIKPSKKTMSGSYSHVPNYPAFLLIILESTVINWWSSHLLEFCTKRKETECVLQLILRSLHMFN